MLPDEQGLVASCPACGRRNPLRYGSLDRPQRCGCCQRALLSTAEPVEITTNLALLPLVNRSSLPVLFDFWAAWCGPSQMLESELRKVARSLAGRVIVAKVNTEELPGLAQAHQIASLPMLSLFWKGREVNRIMGARPAQAIQQWLERGFASVNRS